VFQGISSRKYWQIYRFGGQNANCARNSIRPLCSQSRSCGINANLNHILQCFWAQARSFQVVVDAPVTFYKWLSNLTEVLLPSRDKTDAASIIVTLRVHHWLCFSATKLVWEKNEIAYLPVWQTEWLPAGFTWA